MWSTPLILVCTPSLDVLHSITCRKTSPIGRIKGARLLKVLGIPLLKILIGILKGAKRRSMRKVGLLLKAPHAPILLGLTVAEIGHETLKRMASGTTTATHT